MTDVMPDARTRHAAAQRRHAARLRARGVPRSDDLARALLKGARRCFAEKPVHGDIDQWKRLLDLTLAELADRGFDEDVAWPRLRETLNLPDPDAK